MDALAEEYARRSVQLRHHNSFSAVDDESTSFGHIWYGAEVYVLDHGIKILMFRVSAV